MKRSTIVAVVAATAVVGGGAVAGAAMSGGPSPSPAAQELRPAGGTGDDRSGRDDAGTDDAGTDDTGRDDAAAADGESVVRRVIATALAAADGHVVEVDADGDGGRHWEVEIAGADGRTHDLDVGRDGTTVLGHRREDADDDDHEERAALAEAKVTAAEAVRIAEERFGGEVRELDLDGEERVWDVELRDAAGVGRELEIDVRDGEIRKAERDDDGDDDRNDRDDDDRDDDTDDRNDRDDDTDDRDDRDDDSDDRDDDGRDD